MCGDMFLRTMLARLMALSVKYLNLSKDSIELWVNEDLIFYNTGRFQELLY